MIAVRRYIGILVVAIGSLLGLAALIGVSFDGNALLTTITAPIFEDVLTGLLVTNGTVFRIAGFVFTILILLSALVGFSRQRSQVGIVIMVSALAAGITGWPHLTPFMLIVMIGAHWITVSDYLSHHTHSEARSQESAEKSGASSADDTSQSDRSNRERDASDMADVPKKKSLIRRIFASFFE